MSKDYDVLKMEIKILVHYCVKYGLMLLSILIGLIICDLYLETPVLEVEAYSGYNRNMTPRMIVPRRSQVDLDANMNKISFDKVSKNEKEPAYIPTVQPITNRFDDPVDLYVQCFRLNVRSGCGENYPVVDTIEYGTNIKGIGYVTTDDGDKWIKIFSKEGLKYVKSDYVSEDLPMKYVGDFYITYYCGCEICCDVAGREAASGKMPVSGRTIATDSFIPFGTKLLLNNKVYIVEDRGGAIKGNRIDIYCDTHEEALSYRTKTVPVWMVVDNENLTEYY